MEEIARLTKSVENWKQNIPETNNEDELKTASQVYFDQIHAKFVKLRDYISSYTFVIPSKLFASYQTKQSDFNYLF